MISSPHIIRQVFVSSAAWLAAVSSGGALSFPMVLLQQLRNSNTTMQMDLETASWIGSIQGLAGIPCVLVPIAMQWRGRKTAFIFACLLLIAGWIAIYVAEDASTLLIGEYFHGLGNTSLLAVSMVTITEMMPPTTRHIYAQVFGIVHVASMALSGLLTKYIHWKTISVIMFVPAVMAVLVACMSPESHHWFAIKGEFDKCEKAFIWIRGTDEVSMKELHELMSSQRERVHRRKNKNNTLFRQFMMKFTRRNFNLPIIYMFVLECLMYGSGSMGILVNSTELISKTTQNEHVAQFAGLALNASLFVGYLLTTTALSRYISKKITLLCATAIIVLTMTCHSAVNYLQSVNVIPKQSLLSLYLLMFFYFNIGVGLLPICYLLGVELMPVQHRGVGGAVTELCTSVLHTASIKMAPYLFLYISIWGTFLLYAMCSLICGVIIWRFIPDTTGRTLQEIESYFKHGKFGKENSITESPEVLARILK